MTSSLVPSLWNALLPEMADGLISQRLNPSVDIAESDDAYLISIDVPGVKREDLSIEVRDDVLRVRGHREANFDGAVDGLRHIERRSGSFERTVRIPSGIGEVDAKLEDGVLELKAHKPERVKPRRIKVTSTVEGEAEEKTKAAA